VLDPNPYVFSLMRKVSSNILYRAHPRDKYWFTLADRGGGYLLPKQYRDQFAKKQIVCIEYEQLDDNMQREIFRVTHLS
jgi:hypothetical protein